MSGQGVSDMNKLLREAAFGSSFEVTDESVRGEEGEEKPSIGGKADGGTGGDKQFGLDVGADMNALLREARYGRRS